MSNVDHPDHYGGEDNPYEVIKVIEAWGLGFCLGNVLKYIGRPTKGKYLEDLKKARWYLDQEILKRERAENTVHVKPGLTYSYGGGTGLPRPVKCNSSWGCVHGYHGRQCPLFKDIP